MRITSTGEHQPADGANARASNRCRCLIAIDVRYGVIDVGNEIACVNPSITLAAGPVIHCLKLLHGLFLLVVVSVGCRCMASSCGQPTLSSGLLFAVQDCQALFEQISMHMHALICDDVA